MVRPNKKKIKVRYRGNYIILIIPHEKETVDIADRDSLVILVREISISFPWRSLAFFGTKFPPSRIDSCEVQRSNTRYIRTYFICIRLEEMAWPLMSLADASRKTFSTSPSSFPFGGSPSACEGWSECVLRICQHPRYTLFSEPAVDEHSSSPRARQDFHPSANKKSRVSREFDKQQSTRQHRHRQVSTK